MNELWHINKTYAQKHNYDYFIGNQYAIKVPPYWAKIFLLADAIKLGYEYVMWIDSDAVVDHKKMDLKVEEYWFQVTDQMTKKDTNIFMIYSPDPPVWNSPFMAGVFVLKNTVLTKQFLQEWIDIWENQAKNYWKQNKKGVWNCCEIFDPSGQECKRGKGRQVLEANKCEWAGINYEQGSGVDLLKNPKFSKYVLKVPFTHFSMYEWRLPSDYFYHFAGELYKKRIPYYLDSFNPKISKIKQNKNKKEDNELIDEDITEIQDLMNKTLDKKKLKELRDWQDRLENARFVT